MDEDQLFELQYHDEMEMLAELDCGDCIFTISRVAPWHHGYNADCVMRKTAKYCCGIIA